MLAPRSCELTANQKHKEETRHGVRVPAHVVSQGDGMFVFSLL